MLDNNGLGEGTNTYFTLSFTYDFEAGEHDEVWFAHAMPYTYTDMNKQLISLRDDEECKDFLRLELLAMSLGNLPIPMLTITENVDSYMHYAEELRLFNKVPPYIRKRLRNLQRSIYSLVKQCKRLRGEN